MTLTGPAGRSRGRRDRRTPLVRARRQPQRHSALATAPGRRVLRGGVARNSNCRNGAIGELRHQCGPARMNTNSLFGTCRVTRSAYVPPAARPGARPEFGAPESCPVASCSLRPFRAFYTVVESRVELPRDTQTLQRVPQIERRRPGGRVRPGLAGGSRAARFSL